MTFWEKLETCVSAFWIAMGLCVLVAMVVSLSVAISQGDVGAMIVAACLVCPIIAGVSTALVWHLIERKTK